MIITIPVIFILCAVGFVYYIKSNKDNKTVNTNSEIQPTKYVSRVVGGNDTIEYPDKENFVPSKDAKYENIRDLYSAWTNYKYPDYFEYACSDGENTIILAIYADKYEEIKKDILNDIKNVDNVGFYKTDFTMEELEEIKNEINDMVKDDKDIFGIGIGIDELDDLYYTIGIDVKYERLDELKDYMKKRYGDIVRVSGCSGIEDL